MDNLKELTLVVGAGENFTPNSLMIRYAAMHMGVEFEHRQFFETGLKIDGDSYRYDHWEIEPGDEGQETVTLYMQKLEKELYRWSVECSWPNVVTERVSVLAESLSDAKQLAKESFRKSCGAPLDEIVVSENVTREKADLGLELYKAVKDYHGGYEKVVGFIKRGADVNYRFLPDEYNYTPLHMAAYNGALLKIEWLVEAGCDLNPLDINGCTPLDLAIARHNVAAVVDYLVEHGAMRGLDVVLHNARERSGTGQAASNNKSKDECLLEQ